MRGQDVAAAAQALIGVPFRLNGRDPRTGLDCLGVVAVALDRVGSLPTGIGTCRRDLSRVDSWAGALGLEPAGGPILAGDIVLVRCSPVQPHVLVASGPDRFVHAHAVLRRVVAGPRDPAWPLLRHWRLRHPAREALPRSPEP